ncbi:AMP-binding protein [Streptomyces sp. NPDC048419]|uniref:AMP-binding protein n=1 Tax=Streptomyces sp. NPDC048419 TaxID=3365547 RepID=UPI00371362ED
MTTTTPIATHYEQFLHLLSGDTEDSGATRGTGDPRDTRDAAPGRDVLPARYGERIDASGATQAIVMSRDEWILNQIDLTLALGRLLGEDDVVVSAVPYELSFIGAEMDRVIEMVGASVISVGTSRTICPMERLLALIEQYQVTALVCAPSFAAELASLALARGQRPQDSTIRTVVCVGEASSTERLDRIGATWAATTTTLYGTPATPTAAVPCEHGALHLCEHRLRAEADGHPRGELLLDGSPTGELVELRAAGSGCDCGSANRVLVPLGSTAAALPGPHGLISAVDVERIAFRQTALTPHFACTVQDGAFHVTCAVTEAEAPAGGALAQAIRGEIGDALGVAAEVTVVDAKDWSTATS